MDNLSSWVNKELLVVPAHTVQMSQYVEGMVFRDENIVQPAPQIFVVEYEGTGEQRMYRLPTAESIQNEARYYCIGITGENALSVKADIPCREVTTAPSFPILINVKLHEVSSSVFTLLEDGTV